MKNKQKIRSLLEKIQKIFPKKIKKILTRFSIERKKYYLGKNYSKVYFTIQEARCMKYLSQGFTYNQVGRMVDLSPRTVMFYSSNMQSKLDCTSKDQLIEKVRNSDFLSYL